MYYTDGKFGNSLILRFEKIKDNSYNNFETMMNYPINHNFKTDIMLNEFYKISPVRFIFASITDYTKLYIYLIQQTNWYHYLKIKKFQYYLPINVKLAKEFSFGLYKGFLVFTSTISSNNNDNDFFSYLIFFSYANGTDFTVDITHYMEDIEAQLN